MEELDYIDLPPIENPQEPVSYTYNTESKPSRYTRVYKTSKDHDYGQDERPGIKNKPV